MWGTGRRSGFHIGATLAGDGATAMSRMLEQRSLPRTEGVYGRLLQRMELALDRAERLPRRRLSAAGELEVTGLSPAEVSLVRAYLSHDVQWLRGWHAAAEELELLQRPPRAEALAERQGERPSRSRLGRTSLRCALCGAPHPGTGAGACPGCGSRLFRAAEA